MVRQAYITPASPHGAVHATGGGSLPRSDGTLPQPDGEATVTVIIPTFRRPDVLPRAISSAIRQTLAPAQILVVDDGSDDNSAEVAGSFPAVTLLQQKNAGPASARNLGLRASTGTYVTSLDHDDEWDETFLQVAVDALEVHQADVAWVNFRQTGDYAFTDYLQTDKRPGKLLLNGADGKSAPADHDTALEFFLFSNGAASNSALVFRREALGDGWNPATQVADDLLVLADLLLKKRLKYVFVTKPLWTKHEDAGSFSQNSEMTVRRCLQDFEVIAQLGAGRFTAQDQQRWRRKIGNLRYKLAYHRLWNAGIGAAWAEAKQAFTEAGLTGFALKLLVIACLRKCARTAGIPPLRTLRHRFAASRRSAQGLA